MQLMRPGVLAASNDAIKIAPRETHLAGNYPETGAVGHCVGEADTQATHPGFLAAGDDTIKKHAFAAAPCEAKSAGDSQHVDAREQAKNLACVDDELMENLVR